jgi:hypothetical protein
MEVTGVYNPKSTPLTRMRDRNRAEALGNLTKILTAQPLLVSYVIAGLIAAGFIEKMI